MSITSHKKNKQPALRDPAGRRPNLADRPGGAPTAGCKTHPFRCRLLSLLSILSPPNNTKNKHTHIHTTMLTKLSVKVSAPTPNLLHIPPYRESLLFSLTPLPPLPTTHSPRGALLLASETTARTPASPNANKASTVLCSISEVYRWLEPPSNSVVVLDICRLFCFQLMMFKS